MNESYSATDLVKSLLKALTLTFVLFVIFVGFLYYLQQHRETARTLQGSHAVTSSIYSYPGDYHQPINNYYTYYIDSFDHVDTSKALKLHDLGQFKRWSTPDAPLNLGVNSMNLWFYLPVQNKGDHDICLVWQIKNTTDTAQLFYRNDGHISAHTPIAFSTVMADRKIPLRTLSDSIWLRPGDKRDLLLHIWRSHHNVYLPMSVLPLDETLQEESFLGSVYSIYISVFVFIIFFNIFLYISLKDKIHLWYVFTIGSVCLFLITDAFYDVFLFPDRIHRILSLTETLPFVDWCVVGNGLFMQLLLQQSRKNSYLWLPLKVFVAVDFLCGLTQLSFADYCFRTGGIHYPFHQIHIFNDFLITVTDTLIITSIVEKVVQKQRLALFYFFTTMLPMLGMLNFYLNTLSYTNFRFMYPNSIATGVMLEILILTLMLTQRYNLLQRDKNLILKQHIKLQKDLGDRIMEKQDEERKRIARDLHDGVVGYLGALRLYINTLILNITKKPYSTELIPSLHVIQTRVEKVIEDIRDTSHDLMPVDFGSKKFSDLLNELFIELNQNNTITFELICDESINEIAKVFQVNIYRIALELSTNIIKHSQATKAIVQCLTFADYTLLQVEDDGTGFNPDASPNGIGLKNIKDRVELMNGKIEIDSNQVATIITIEIPHKNESN